MPKKSKLLVLSAILSVSLLIPFQNASADCNKADVGMTINPKVVSNATPQTKFYVSVASQCKQDIIVYLEDPTQPNYRYFGLELPASSFRPDSTRPSGWFLTSVEFAETPFADSNSTVKKRSFVAYARSKSTTNVVGKSIPIAVDRSDPAAPPAPPNNPPNTPPIGNPPGVNPPSAQNPGLDPDTATIKSPIKSANVTELIRRIITVLLSLITMVAVVMIIVSGFKMVMFSGSPAELGKAKTSLMWAIGGLILALMAFAIVAMVERMLAK